MQKGILAIRFDPMSTHVVCQLLEAHAAKCIYIDVSFWMTPPPPITPLIQDPITWGSSCLE